MDKNVVGKKISPPGLRTFSPPSHPQEEDNYDFTYNIKKILSQNSGTNKKQSKSPPMHLFFQEIAYSSLVLEQRVMMHVS